MINPDMSVPVVMHSDAMTWQRSPSDTVERKRFHLVGPPESGQVTSLVRYLPGAAFPSHPHPDGEELLILEGVFSDQAGDWAAGSFLLNPEGFEHAPFSQEGCLLFVKLRQYPGKAHVTLRLEDVPAQPLPGTARGTEKLLHDDGEERTSLLELASGESLKTTLSGGAEGFVLSGKLTLQENESTTESLAAFDWFRLPAGAHLQLESEGCRLYLKQGGVERLRSSP